MSGRFQSIGRNPMTVVKVRPFGRIFSYHRGLTVCGKIEGKVEGEEPNQ